MAELTKLHYRVDTRMVMLKRGILIPIEKLKKAALKDGYPMEQVERMKYNEIECDIDELFSKKTKTKIIPVEVKWMKLANLVVSRYDEKEKKKKYSIKQKDNLLMNMYLSKRIKQI